MRQNVLWINGRSLHISSISLIVQWNENSDNSEERVSEIMSWSLVKAQKRWLRRERSSRSTRCSESAPPDACSGSDTMACECVAPFQSTTSSSSPRNRSCCGPVSPMLVSFSSRSGSDDASRCRDTDEQWANATSVFSLRRVQARKQNCSSTATVPAACTLCDAVTSNTYNVWPPESIARMSLTAMTGVYDLETGMSVSSRFTSRHTVLSRSRPISQLYGLSSGGSRRLHEKQQRFGVPVECHSAYEQLSTLRTSGRPAWRHLFTLDRDGPQTLYTTC